MEQTYGNNAQLCCSGMRAEGDGSDENINISDNVQENFKLLMIEEEGSDLRVDQNISKSDTNLETKNDELKRK